MKKLIIVALGVCILGTACSRDNNLAEKNTLQQPLEQSVMLQTEEIEIQSTKESSSEQEIILLSEEPAEKIAGNLSAITGGMYRISDTESIV